MRSEALKDRTFLQELFLCASLEEAQDKLAEKDIDMTIEEIKRTLELLDKYPHEKLTEEDLETVAGGTMGPAWEDNEVMDAMRSEREAAFGGADALNDYTHTHC